MKYEVPDTFCWVKFFQHYVQRNKNLCITILGLEGNLNVV